MDALAKLHDKHAGSTSKKEAAEADAEADAEAGTKDGTEMWHDDWNDEWHHEWQPGYVGYYYDDNGAETIDLEAEAKHKESEESEDRKRKARRNTNRHSKKHKGDEAEETTVHCEKDTKRRRKKKRKAVKTPEEGVEPQGHESTDTRRGHRSPSRQPNQEALVEAGEPQKTKKANGIHHGMVSIRAS